MKLRSAGDKDRAYFLRLRNDSQTVAFSYSRKPVAEEEHTVWWDMTGDLRYVAVSEFGGDVGTVRLTPLDEHACEIHIIVAPEARGLGHAVRILQWATTEARRLGYKRITARVDAPNTASLRAFLRAGYTVTSPGTLLVERDI